MASRPTSSHRLHFRSLDGAPLTAPPEWRPTWVVVDVPPEQWEAVRLRCNDREVPLQLRHLAGHRRVLAEWPPSGTGHYHLRLDDPDGSDIMPLTIWPTKISRDAYLQMLADLEARLPTSVAIALQRAGALTGIHLLPPTDSTLAQELVRLRRAVQGSPRRPGITEILPAIGRDPYHVLTSITPWVMRQSARRPHPTGIAQALGRQHNLDDQGRLKRVLDLRVNHTVDVYENRLVGHAAIGAA